MEPGATVACVLSGGNNDVSRSAEILERSLVDEGLKHYFLVEFLQVPGRCEASSTRCSDRTTASSARPVLRWWRLSSRRARTSPAC